MFHVILFEPEIPPNTGNIIRLCANTGAELHLVHPLGFAMEDRQLRRAGLDYREWARVREHADLDAFTQAVEPARLVALTTRAGQAHHAFRALLFGPETRGLPDAVLDAVPEGQQLRVPMVPGSRSLNLSNAVAVVLYEAWRQLGFIGSA